MILYFLSIQVNLLMNRIDEAKSDYEKAIHYNPNFGVAYVQKCYTDYRFAIFNRDVELVEEAMKDFEKAFTKFPDRSDCYMLYAQVCRNNFLILKEVIKSKL